MDGDFSTGSSADELRSLLRADLVAAMRARQPEVVSALRTAIAAIDNAEAVAPPDTPATGPLAAQTATPGGPTAGAPSEHVAGGQSGVGSTEVTRRDLSAAEVHALLQAQLDERLLEADRYDAHGQPDAADRLRREAEALRRYTSP